MISSQIPSNQENYNIKIYYENLENIPINDEQYKEYKHYYFNLKNKEDISNLIITVRGTWDENNFLPFEKIGFAYGGPYLVDFNEVKLVKNNFKGNNIFFKVKNLINDQKYLFSMPSNAKLIIGDLFKENGVLNEEYQNPSKYMLNEDLFKSNNIITIKYSGSNQAELYYELLEGEVIKNNKYNDYKNYKLNFNDNNKIHYLGLYDQNINTYAYINNEDNNIKILYKDGNDKLSPVLPTVNKNKNFFPLVSQYNLITFVRNKNSIATSDKEFTIFNPELTEENLYYPYQGKFYLKRNTDKVIKLKNDGLEKDVYRIVTRSYEEYSVELNINLNYKYILNNTNKYTNVWEVSKGESFSLKALASENNLLFTKILEGSIYNSFILSNNTNKELNSNFLFPWLYSLNF